MAGRFRSVVACALLVLLTGACEIATEVNLSIDDDGTGELVVAVVLDEDAAQRLAAIGDPDTSDLVATGWVVTGPAVEDGSTVIRARHEIEAPDQIQPLFDQLAGSDGPFQDFQVVREDSFAETRWEFSGTVDFSAGAAPVRDDELDATLEAEGLADALSLIGDRIDAVVEDTLSFEVAVRLPGEVTSNAPTRARNGAVWRPSITERAEIELVATGVVSRSERVVARWVAIGAGVVLVLFLVVRAALAFRRRRRAV